MINHHQRNHPENRDSQLLALQPLAKRRLLSALCSEMGLFQLKMGRLTTVGVDFSIYEMEVEGMPIKCQLWDIAGEEASILLEFSS